MSQLEDKEINNIAHPVKSIKKRLEDNKIERIKKAEQDYWDDVFENLENYDGTPESQKEVRENERK